jgi:hypothetical protein
LLIVLLAMASLPFDVAPDWLLEPFLFGAPAASAVAQNVIVIVAHAPASVENRIVIVPRENPDLLCP